MRASFFAMENELKVLVSEQLSEGKGKSLPGAVCRDKSREELVSCGGTILGERRAKTGEEES